jgi:alpha-1,3-rhamnosyl/mannosyltransferase
MHIVVDARASMPHFPGIGRYTFDLVQALASFLAPPQQLTVLHSPAAIVPEGIPTTRTSSGLFSLRQQWAVPSLLRRLQAHVYHSLYYAMPYWPLVPTVLTVCDLIPLRYPAYVSPQARWLFPVLLRLALHAARHVIAISEATRRDLCQYCRVYPERITVIPLAPDPRFSPQPELAMARFRAQLKLPEAYVLYLGSNKPHKNLVRLVEAWARIANTTEAADWSLVLAGAWDERYPQAQTLAQKLGVQGRIRFFGRVPEAALPLLYSGAGLFVFPSLYEGFGLPVLEAMACGVPTICSRTSSLPEVGGEAAGYFDPLNIEDIATTMWTYIGDTKRRRALQSAALRQVQRFSWADTARRTLAVYRQVVTPAVAV